MVVPCFHGIRKPIYVERVWNVRGLNTRAHRDAVCQLVLSKAISLVCLQETKHESISDYDVI
jgi:hypothetical protein